ncbi:MAG: hypothetical protein QOC89_2844 [Paraburkholderia sp.]|nr:hypothetical protein [Paraburkholderia sp.]
MGHLQEIDNEMGQRRDGVRELVQLSVNLTAMAHSTRLQDSWQSAPTELVS